MLAHIITVNVLATDPIIPVTKAPITAWFRKFGMAPVSHWAIPGSDKYATNPIPNPTSQNTKIVSLLDNLTPASVNGFAKRLYGASSFHVFYIFMQ